MPHIIALNIVQRASIPLLVSRINVRVHGNRIPHSRSSADKVLRVIIRLQAYE